MNSLVVNPPELRKTAGYNHAVVRDGIPVFLTGQVSWDLEGTVVGVGDIATQARQAWSNVNALVAALGATREDIVKITTYVTDIAHLPAVGAAKQEQFAGATMPASTFVVVRELASADLLVEIEAIVMVAGRKAS